MFFCIKTIIVNITAWTFLAVTVVSLLFVPQLVFAYVVTLNQPPPNVDDGELVIFTGTVMIPCGIHETGCFPHPVSDVTVQIIDQVSDMAIATDVTDIDGEFSAQWNAEYRDNNYLIFAIAYTPGNATSTNQDYPLSVNPPNIETNIQLILESPIPSTQVTLGQSMTFSGHLVANDKFDKRINLVVNGVAILVTRTNQNGEFSISWTPQSQDVRGHQIYVLSDEYEVKSNSYSVEILPVISYTVKIITDTTSGTVPFWIRFDAEVNGGIAPYNFLWDISGETRTKQSFDKQFMNADTYLVTLTVTDSQSQTRAAQVTIFAKNPPTPSLNPQIMTEQKNVKEGDGVLFFTDVSDTARVKSYEWRVDDKPISSSKKAYVVFFDEGTYIVSLNVVDTDGKSFSVTKPVSVLNVPPAITSNLQNFEIESNEALPLDVLFTDPGTQDNFTIEFFVNEQKLDVRHQNSPVPTVFSFNLDPGSYDAKVVVTDNDGGKDERYFSIVIKEPRLPIEIVIGIVIAAGAGGGYGIKKYLDSRDKKPDHGENLRIEIRILRSGIER